MKKKDSREDRSIEKDIKSHDIGYVIKILMDKKGIKISKLCTDLETHGIDVTPNHMGRMLNGKIRFRADYIAPIISLLKDVSWTDFNKMLEALTEESKKSGRLYYKRPYHPKKDKKEDDN